MRETQSLDFLGNNQIVLCLNFFGLPDWPKHKGPEKGINRAVEHLGDSNQGQNVYQGNINEHGPVHVALLVVVRDETRNISEHFS